jgi:pimeloyl-ACP methyl ester carboxylesterase
MAVWQEGTIETNGINLHYIRTGADKTPIVLVHGLTENALSWSRLARRLEQTYDFIMYDARGHGLSDKPETGYTPLDHMQDLAGVIQGLGLHRPIVMGHSMGAITASWLSAEHPEMVRATILEEPVWRWPKQAEQSADEKRRIYENWRVRLEMRKMLSTAESYTRGRRERPLWSTEDHDADVPAKEQVSMQALEYILHHEQTWAQQVAKFQSPVLLIYGNNELGSIVGPDIAAEARRINPLVEPRQIASAGHAVRRESFDEYVAVLREFLAYIQRNVL